MNQPAADDIEASSTNAEQVRHKQLKRELIYAASALLTGFIVLPLLIFMVGTLLLGPYAGGKSLGDFLAEFYGNLGQGAARTWFIGLSPYLAFWLVRLSFRRYRSDRAPSADEPPPPAPPPPAKRAQPKETGGRREPFIGS